MAIRWLSHIALLTSAAQCLPFFTNGTIPANLTTACADSLLTDVVQCPATAANFMNGFYYPTDVLEGACSGQCSTALEQFEANVKSACAGQTWAGYDDENDAPLDIIANLMRFNRDLACIQDSGRWCNVVAAAVALEADPGRMYSELLSALLLIIVESPAGWDSTAPSNVQSSGPCDLCFIKSLKMQAESPYYYGPGLRSLSVYESKTSSCGVAGYPLSTSTLPWQLYVYQLTGIHISSLTQ
jgi:hypothetical protein